MATCASELPHLLSLASGALALNLAYLNLERFRYAKAILNAAKEAMDRVEKNEDLDFTKTKSYKQLQTLIQFPAANDSTENGGQKLGPSLRLTGFLYVRVFLKPPIDRIAGIVFVITSATALMLGAGHPIGILASTCWFFSAEYIHISYWLLVAGIAFPMVFLTLGSSIQQTCRRVAERIEGDLGQVMQRSARDAAVDGQ